MLKPVNIVYGRLASSNFPRRNLCYIFSDFFLCFQFCQYDFVWKNVEPVGGEVSWKEKPEELYALVLDSNCPNSTDSFVTSPVCNN